MIEGSCHCGGVRFEYLDVPTHLNSCNCSVCRRIGGLWAYAPLDRIRIHAAPDATIGYVHGDKTLTLHTCKTCGCTTHWTPLDPVQHPRMAVNMRMAEPDIIAAIRVRHFDGADTWEYLD